MGKLTKNQKLIKEKIEPGKVYTLKEAAEMVKEITFTKFDASVDIDVRLGVDPRKANQMVRGVVSLPHGTGKQVRVLCLCSPDAEAAAKEAGADYVGLDEYIEKIKGGWTDIDVIITQPAIMGKIGALGRVLGPRGLMPNPKSGTVTPDVAKRIVDFLYGTIYAINGDLQKLGGGIFLCTPNNVNVEGNITDDQIPQKGGSRNKKDDNEKEDDFF